MYQGVSHRATVVLYIRFPFEIKSTDVLLYCLYNRYWVSDNSSFCVQYAIEHV
jgi:hypothetical protein